MHKPALFAVLEIEDAPPHLRRVVERAMMTCIPSVSELVIPGQPVEDAHWYTRWIRTPSGVSCREVITGTSEELAALNAELEQYGIGATLRRVA